MTAIEHFFEALSQHPSEHIAISDGQGLQLTYSQLISEINQLCNYLGNLAPVGIAVIMDNGVAATVSDLALLSSKHWCLPLPPFFTEQQITHALNDSGCQYVISSRPQLGKIMATITIADQDVFILQLKPTIKAALPKNTKKITYTSGSTGTPKGLCLSAQHQIETALAITSTLQIKPPFKHLSLLPWSVLLENIAGLYACLYIGGTCVTPPLSALTHSSFTYDYEAINNLAGEESIDSTIMVPDQLRQYSQYLDTHTATIHPWQFIAVGGATVPTSLLDKCKSQGLPVYQGYGLSEAASVVSLNSPNNNKPGSVGKPLIEGDVLIGERSEVFLRSARFLGTTNSATAPTGLYPTGDIGYIDAQGYLYISGRLKTVLITGMGRNVSPEWIEDQLLAIAGVRQAFVFADDADQLGALIVSAPETDNIDYAVTMFNKALPEYARLSQWHCVESFTVRNHLLTSNGKLNRLNLRQHAMALSSQSIDSYAYNTHC